MKHKQTDHRQNSEPATQPSLSTDFMLDDWLVAPHCNQIRKRGQSHQLESRVMAVLQYLASHQGQVISRETLEREIWGNSVVSYDALTSCIAKLRKALDDKPRDPRYIATVPKKGYRLIAPVSSLTMHGEASPRQKNCGPENSQVQNTTPKFEQALADHQTRPLLAVALSLLLALLLTTAILVSNHESRVQNSSVENGVAAQGDQVPSLVVLPFADFSTDPIPNLAAGITDDITNALAGVSELQVIARASAQSFRHTTEPRMNLRQVSRELGVTYILQGSLRRLQQGLRVNISLVNADNGIQLWSDTYNTGLKELFSLQDQISVQVVEKLSLKLRAEEKARLALRYTVSLDAYDYFLQGQMLYTHHTTEANLQARSLFQKAIEQDAGFARAYGAKALTYLDDYRYQWQGDEQKPLSEAMRLARKTLELDPKLAQGYWVMANISLFRKQFQNAMDFSNRALALKPSYADAYATLAVSTLYSNNDARAAIPLIRKAMRLNPQQPARYRSALGQAYYFLGLHEAASIELQAAIDSNSLLTPARIYQIANLRKLGEFEEANWQAQQLHILSPQFRLSAIDRMFPLSASTMAEDIRQQLRQAGVS